MIFGLQRSNYVLPPLSILLLMCQFVQKVEMRVNGLKQLLRLGAVQPEQNLWFSIRMKWSWSTFWWVKIMRGWPGQSVRWRCWGEEGRSEGSRKGERDCGKGSGRKKRTQGDRWATLSPWCKTWGCWHTRPTVSFWRNGSFVGLWIDTQTHQALKQLIN